MDKNQFKQPLIFALSLLPIAAVAGIFVTIYQLEIYPPELLAEAITQLGSTTMLIVISTIQAMGYAFICGFFGCILARALGLWRPFVPAKKPLLVTLAASLIGGMLFSLDYWTFGAIIDGVQASAVDGLTLNAFLASMLYGGVIEEVMMRLFFMSLIAFVLWKLFYKKHDRDSIPTSVLVIANVVAAVLFAAGHLPSTALTFGSLTLPILVRCFLLNGAFGLLFGRLYRKYGIFYAMISHALFHIIAKTIWLIFI